MTLRDDDQNDSLFSSEFEPTAQEFSVRLAAAQNSASALGQLLEECRQYLWAVASQKLESGVRPKVAPSDIVQETLAKAALDFPRFNGSSQNELRAWLRRILLNTLIDQYRRKAWTPCVPLDQVAESDAQGLMDPQLTPRRSLDQKESASQLNAALALLSEDHQVVIRLRHFEQCSFAEIGRRLDRSEDAAQQLWCRAMRKLREKVKWEG